LRVRQNKFDALLRWRQGLCVVAVAGLAVWSGLKPTSLIGPRSTASDTVGSQLEIDHALSAAAASALSGREGTIIVLDPQTGRIRAIVNPKVAFENAYAPGSTIKPFTTLAALRAGLIDKNSRALCHERYSHQGFSTVCAHQRDLPPFDPSQAIAYSCNYYFGRLGERLDEKLLSDTLSSFGFGKRAMSTGEDRDGQLLRGKIDPRNALGEGTHLQATPIQLITAYTALLNGGRLLTPELKSSEEFQVHERSHLDIAAEHRSLILDGMRGAIAYGTASRAGLNSSEFGVFGKTGTSTPLQGFRSQGWFVGFAAASSEPEVAPDQVRLAVLVFLKKGHGSEAAAVSRPVFQEFSRWKDQLAVHESELSAKNSNQEEPARGWAATVMPAFFKFSNAFGFGAGMRSHPDPSASQKMIDRREPSSPSSERKIKVHLVSENVTRELALEDYVATVVATEGSAESQPEALKALAVVVRTYALKNLGRHAKDGYDFCSTTHCQRYQFANDPTANTQVYEPAMKAVRATTGQVLHDQTSALAEPYFSASCGGVTANIHSLWGANSLPYLQGVRDEFCESMPHHEWRDAIPAERLMEALRTDQRTDPGLALKAVRILRHDNTGRAQLISIEGEKSHVVRGWDFKIIVGRRLGWNFLKSSKFEIGRLGPDYIFQGYGFGHGLGLCQEGAHVMAQRHWTYERILGRYFPGTYIARESREGVIAQAQDETHSAKSNSFADLIWKNATRYTFRSAPSAGRASLSSEHFRASYPVTLPQRDVAQILRTLETTRTGLINKVSAAGLASSSIPAAEIFINDTTGNFVGRTGLPWWAAAATKNNRIELQPAEVLRRRGVLETTLKHELVHIIVDQISRGNAARWLTEGMALYFAGEGRLLARYASKSKMTVEQIEAALKNPTSQDEMRRAYAAAYQEVSRLIKADGEARLWQRVARSQ